MGSLFKFGARAHMEQFLEEGLLSMNTLAWFSEVEDEGLQRERGDGFVRWWQGTLLTRNLGEMVIADAPPVKLHSSELQEVNVFCMYHYGQHSAWVDPRNHCEGEMCAVIHRQAALLERVVAAFEAQSQFERLASGDVHYVEARLRHAAPSPFEKTLAYSYQHEFRIALSPGLGYPCQFRIGDLTDIGSLMYADTVNRVPMRANLLPPKH